MKKFIIWFCILTSLIGSLLPGTSNGAETELNATAAEYYFNNGDGTGRNHVTTSKRTLGHKAVIAGKVVIVSAGIGAGIALSHGFAAPLLVGVSAAGTTTSLHSLGVAARDAFAGAPRVNYRTDVSTRKAISDFQRDRYINKIVAEGVKVHNEPDSRSKRFDRFCERMFVEGIANRNEIASYLATQPVAQISMLEHDGTSAHFNYLEVADLAERIADAKDLDLIYGSIGIVEGSERVHLV